MFRSQDGGGSGVGGVGGIGAGASGAGASGAGASGAGGQQTVGTDKVGGGQAGGQQTVGTDKVAGGQQASQQSSDFDFTKWDGRDVSKIPDGHPAKAHFQRILQPAFDPASAYNQIIESMKQRNAAPAAKPAAQQQQVAQQQQAAQQQNLPQSEIDKIVEQRVQAKLRDQRGEQWNRGFESWIKKPEAIRVGDRTYHTPVYSDAASIQNHIDFNNRLAQEGITPSQTYFLANMERVLADAYSLGSREGSVRQQTAVKGGTGQQVVEGASQSGQNAQDSGGSKSDSDLNPMERIARKLNPELAEKISKGKFLS